MGAFLKAVRAADNNTPNKRNVWLKSQGVPAGKFLHDVSWVWTCVGGHFRDLRQEVLQVLVLLHDCDAYFDTSGHDYECCQQEREEWFRGQTPASRQRNSRGRSEGIMCVTFHRTPSVWKLLRRWDIEFWHFDVQDNLLLGLRMKELSSECTRIFFEWTACECFSGFICT